MTAVLLRFEVIGRPVPQGSNRAFTPKGGSRAFIVAGNQATLSKWRGDIRNALEGSKPPQPVAGPVRMDLTFGLTRPKSHYHPVTKSRRVIELRADAPAFYLGKPDTDKLERAVLDALTGVVYLDDSQVFEVTGRKVWIEPGEPGLRAEVGYLETIPSITDMTPELVAATAAAPGQVGLFEEVGD